MKKLAATSMILAVTGLCGVPALADNHEQPNLDPVNLYACTFKEGKGMSDLDRLDAKYRKWAEKNDPDQSSWRIVPALRDVDEPFDVGYIGSWNTGEAMGKGLDAWFAADLNGAYQDVIECGHSLWVSATINAPNGPPENGIVWFASCSVQEGATDQQAFDAHKSMSASMRDMGGKSQSWLFYPSLGSGTLEFDYFSVVTFNSMAELGEGWEMYYNKGGWKKAADVAAVTSCNVPRVYTVTGIRMGPQE